MAAQTLTPLLYTRPPLPIQLAIPDVSRAAYHVRKFVQAFCLLDSSPDPTHYAEKGMVTDFLVVLNQQARDRHVRMRYACIDILSECTEISLWCMSV